MLEKNKLKCFSVTNFLSILFVCKAGAYLSGEHLTMIHSTPKYYFRLKIRHLCHGPMLHNFFIRNLRIFVISWSVCHLQAFKASFNCVTIRSEPTRMKLHVSGAPLLGRLLALPKTIRLGWIDLSGQTL